MSECVHEANEATVNVTRMTHEGAPDRYMAEVMIRCVGCGARYRFLGLPVGMHIAGATTNWDGFEALLAVEPKRVAS